MTRRLALAALITLIALVGCAGSPPTDVPLPDDFPPQDTPVPVGVDVNAALGDVVVLKPGSTAHYADADLNVRFIAVTEDSRCGIDVQCVWAGLARVSLEVTSGDGAPQALQLETQGGQQVSGQVGNYTITLIEVAPQPVSTHPIQPDEYLVTIRVDG